MLRDDDDVMDRCAHDSSPSRRFYSLMTSPDDDDVIDGWKPESECSMDSECLQFNTRMSCDSIQEDSQNTDDRLAAGPSTSNDKACNDSEQLGLAAVSSHQHTDVIDQSDCTAHPGTFRPETVGDRTTLNVLERTKDMQQTYNNKLLPDTTNQQPITDRTGTSGNGIMEYDRKLIDEIDAAMAHAQTLRVLRRHSDHVTQDSAHHRDHVTQYGESDRRDLEECGSRSREKRGQGRLSVISKHQQSTTATDTAGLLEGLLASSGRLSVCLSVTQHCLNK